MQVLLFQNLHVAGEIHCRIKFCEGWLNVWSTFCLNLNKQAMLIIIVMSHLIKITQIY